MDPIAISAGMFGPLSVHLMDPIAVKAPRHAGLSGSDPPDGSKRRETARPLASACQPGGWHWRVLRDLEAARGDLASSPPFLGERRLVTSMNQPSLPHHRLQVWHLALELVRLVHGIRIADAEDRRQARSAASSCARNISRRCRAHFTRGQGPRLRHRARGVRRGGGVCGAQRREGRHGRGRCRPRGRARKSRVGNAVSARVRPVPPPPVDQRGFDPPDGLAVRLRGASGCDAFAGSFRRSGKARRRLLQARAATAPCQSQ